MTTTDDTLACTFEAMACGDCQRVGRTAEQCADHVHPEQVLRLARAAGLTVSVDERVLQLT